MQCFEERFEDDKLDLASTVSLVLSSFSVRQTSF